MTAGNEKFSRRAVLAGTAAAAFTVPVFYVNRGRAAGTLVVRDPGGPWTKAGQEGFYKPFTKETGIEIVQVAAAHEPISQVKAMVDAKAYTWDVVILTVSNQDLLGPQGYLEEIPFTGAMTEIIPSARSKWFMGTDVYSTTLTYRTDTMKKPLGKLGRRLERCRLPGTALLTQALRSTSWSRRSSPMVFRETSSIRSTPTAPSKNSMRSSSTCRSGGPAARKPPAPEDRRGRHPGHLERSLASRHRRWRARADRLEPGASIASKAGLSRRATRRLTWR